MEILAVLMLMGKIALGLVGIAVLCPLAPARDRG